MNQQMAQLLDALQDVDDAPTSQLVEAFEQRSKALTDLLSAWPQAQTAAKTALR